MSALDDVAFCRHDTSFSRALNAAPVDYAYMVASYIRCLHENLLDVVAGFSKSISKMNARLLYYERFLSHFMPASRIRSFDICSRRKHCISHQMVSRPLVSLTPTFHGLPFLASPSLISADRARFQRLFIVLFSTWARVSR